MQNAHGRILRENRQTNLRLFAFAWYNTSKKGRGGLKTENNMPRRRGRKEVSMIDPRSAKPMYVQLKDILELEIQQGIYGQDDRLPSEQELCAKYQVSRITVRQALKILEQNGMTYSVPGKGTFVKTAEIHQKMTRILTFGETLAHGGMQGYTEIFSYTPEVQNDAVRKMLALKKDQTLARLELLGFAQNMPVVYYVSHMEGGLAARMHEKMLAMQEQRMAFSTFDMYQALSISLGRVEQKMSAANMEGELAQIFRQELSKQALLTLESMYYDPKEHPVEYKMAYYRADVFAFHFEREL